SRPVNLPTNWRTTTAATATRLKKRSAANSTSPKPPEELTFFVDRQLGRYKMAGALRIAGLNVEIHDDHFAQDAKDEEWLMVVGQKNWVVVTRDERIRYRAAAKQAIRRAKVRAFVLTAQGKFTSRNVGRDFSQSASEDSANCQTAKAAIYREDFTRRRCHSPRVLIALTLSWVKARL